MSLDSSSESSDQSLSTNGTHSSLFASDGTVGIGSMSNDALARNDVVYLEFVPGDVSILRLFDKIINKFLCGIVYYLCMYVLIGKCEAS